jgi:hypothetical protein
MGPKANETGQHSWMFDPFGMAAHAASPVPGTPNDANMPGGTTNVTNHNTFNIQGDDQNHRTKVTEELAVQLSDAQNANQGDGGGLYRSPLDSGTGR